MSPGVRGGRGKSEANVQDEIEFVIYRINQTAELKLASFSMSRKNQLFVTEEKHNSSRNL
jgi:hypothetical protein